MIEMQVNDEHDLDFAHLVQICVAGLQIIPILLIWFQHRRHSRSTPNGMQQIGLWGVTLYEILLCLQIVDPWGTEGTLRGIYLLAFLATVIEAKLITAMVLGCLYLEFTSFWVHGISRTLKEPNCLRYWSRGVFLISAVGTIASCYLGWGFNTKYHLVSASVLVYVFFNFLLLIWVYCRLQGAFSGTNFSTIDVELIKRGYSVLTAMMLFYLLNAILFGVSLYDSYSEFGDKLVASEDEGENLLLQTFKASGISTAALVSNIGIDDSILVLLMVYMFWVPARAASGKGHRRNTESAIGDVTMRQWVIQQQFRLNTQSESFTAELEETKTEIEMVKRLETQEGLDSSAGSVKVKALRNRIPAKQLRNRAPQKDPMQMTSQEVHSINADEAGYPSMLGYYIQDPEKPPQAIPSRSNDGVDHSLEDTSSFAETITGLNFRTVQ